MCAYTHIITVICVVAACGGVAGELSGQTSTDRLRTVGSHDGCTCVILEGERTRTRKERMMHDSIARSASLKETKRTPRGVPPELTKAKTGDN